MTNIVELELSRALAAAGCGIVRRREPPEVKALPQLPAPVSFPPLPPGTIPKLRTLQQAVALRTGVSVLDIQSPRRKAGIVRARMIFYALAHRVTAASSLQIGKACGGRDHSTVLHGLWKVETYPEKFEPELSNLVNAFREGKDES